VPCPLLERFVSFLPAYDQNSPFEEYGAAYGTIHARKSLIADVKAETRDKYKTHRRVWEVSNLVLCMLYTGSIKQVANEALADKPLPYMTAEGDLLDVAYLDNWIAFGERRVHDCVAEHVEFRLQTEAYQRGAAQIVDEHRQRRRSETEACIDAIRAVQEYARTWQTLNHVCERAKTVGQHLYNLCTYGGAEFVLQQGRRLLEVGMHDDNHGRHGGTGHQHEPGVGEG
jgi:hypothetical protein